MKPWAVLSQILMISLFFLGCTKMSSEVIESASKTELASSSILKWTTNPEPSNSLVYNADKTLTFAASSGVTVKCLYRVFGTSVWSERACTTSNSIKTIEGDYEYAVSATSKSAKEQLPAVRVNTDKTAPLLNVTSERLSDGKTINISLIANEKIAYIVYKKDGQVVSGNSTVLNFSIILTDEALHTFEFTISDYAGNLSQAVVKEFKRNTSESQYNSLAAGQLLQRNNDDKSGVLGNGSSLSWDGKLVIRTMAPGWILNVLRPQSVGISSGLGHDINITQAFSPTVTLLQQKFFKNDSNAGYGAYDNTNYVKMLYRILLNREADSGGLNAYVNALDTGASEPQDIYNAFIASQEYQNLVAANPKHTQHPTILPFSKFTEYNALSLAPYYTDRAFLMDAYQNLLGRDPDEGGFNYWLNQLKTQSRESVAQAFISAGGSAALLPHKFKNYNRLSVKENPYPSDIRGEYSASGVYKTYDMQVYTQVYKIFMYNSVAAPYGRNRDLETLAGDTIGVMRLRVIIQNPDTESASVAGYYWVEDFKPLADSYGNAIIGIEPSLTADGLLMVFNENRGQGVLKYAFTEDPLKPTSWTAPKHLTAMYTDKDKIVNGVKFSERYALAKKPIKAANGETYTAEEGIKGAYPWISWEGSELYFTSLVSQHSNPAVNARRAGASVVGQWTGNSVRLLDGFLNKSLLAYEKLVLITGGIGSTSSIWNPFKELRDPKLPFLYERPSVMLMGFNDETYNDISFKEFVDGRYVVAWPMNETLKKINAVSDNYYNLVDLNKTPDLSGNLNTGILNSGAYFYSTLGPASTHDRHIGYKGQAVIFNADGAVTAAPHALMQKMDSFTAEGFIYLYQNTSMNLVRFGSGANNSINISYSAGKLQASITTNVISSIDSGAMNVPAGTWTHFAVTYDHAGGVLKLYINGKMASQKDVAPVALQHPANYYLTVGPAAASSSSAVVAIDEFRLSYVARSSTEIADAAHLPYSQRFDFNFALPQRFTKSMLNIPDEQAISISKAQLGAILFNDNRLSSNNSVSCASCHAINGNLTDSRNFSIGFNGQTLKRHSPVVFNRALSSTQMWDGKFSSLHSQTLGPVNNPNEMNLSSSDLLSKINSIEAYRKAFNMAYGQAPTLNNIQQALSAFLSIMMTENNSPVDQFELTGQGLTEQQIRGRKLFYGQARCVACHSGPNYSDEQLHNVGFFADAVDVGLQGVTNRESDKHYFKTPSLRNIAQTAPYMHDGSFVNLEQVIVRYNQGSLTDANRSHELKPLNLGPQDIQDLAEFLRSLNSQVKPRLPIDTGSGYTIEKYVQGL